MHCVPCDLMLPADARFCAGCGQALPGAVGAKVARSPSGVIAIVVGAVVLFVVGMIGIIAAIAIPNLLHAIDRGKQKRTMIDMRAVATAIEAYSQQHGSYPEAANFEQLRPLLQPYARTLPEHDGWGHPFHVSSTPEGYELVSAGKDGVVSGCDGGETSRFAEDICLTDGQLTQWPQGAQR